MVDVRPCSDPKCHVLRPSEAAVLIVGRNRTTANGQLIDIPTPSLIADIAARLDYEVEELIPLETWPRYGLHSRNGVAGEDAIVIRKK